MNSRILVTSKSAISPSSRPFFDEVPRIEVWFAIGFFVLLLVLKIFYAVHYRIDSDEPQHLHVVWGWTQHMIPYRDYFDNHSPLFQMLCAPLLGRLGRCFIASLRTIFCRQPVPRHRACCGCRNGLLFSQFPSESAYTFSGGAAEIRKECRLYGSGL